VLCLESENEPLKIKNMRLNQWKIWVLGFGMLTLPVWGADFMYPIKPFKDGILIPPTRTFKDLYVLGAAVTMESPVKGDLCLLGGRVQILASIRGNLESLARSIEVEDPVGGNVRVAAGGITVDSPIGGDLVAAAKKILFSEKAALSGDAVLAGDSIDLEGPVQGKALIAGNHVVLNGLVLGKSLVHYDHLLVLGSQCRLRGKLECYGPCAPLSEKGSVVSGVDYHFVESFGSESSRFSRWTAVFGLPALIRLSVWILSAWVLMRLFPNKLELFLKSAVGKFWTDLSFGFLILLVGIIGIPLLFFTIVGLYLALMAGLSFLTALLLSRLLSVFYLARLLRGAFEEKAPGPLTFRWVAGGILTLHLMGLIPWLGWFFPIGLSLASLGLVGRLAVSNRRWVD
jgi:hypothetical protein